MSQYLEEYAMHPEAMAGDEHRNPCSADTRGVLTRLNLSVAQKTHIGKEVDRLDEETGTVLEGGGPAEMQVGPTGPTLSEMDVLNAKSRKAVADEIGISVRRLQDILKGRSVLHKRHIVTLRRIASGLA